MPFDYAVPILVLYPEKIILEVLEDLYMYVCGYCVYNIYIYIYAYTYTHTYAVYFGIYYIMKNKRSK